jgi:hypothetical protein
LYRENETKEDKMEKLNLEVTVVVTEKMTIKKELERVDASFRKMRNDYKEQRTGYELLIDENNHLTK